VRNVAYTAANKRRKIVMSPLLFDSRRKIQLNSPIIAKRKASEKKNTEKVISSCVLVIEFYLSFFGRIGMSAISIVSLNNIYLNTHQHMGKKVIRARGLGSYERNIQYLF
jgi:hypothetical protein